MKLITPARISALKTGLRSVAAILVFTLLHSLKLPVEYAGFLAAITPIILKAIDPTFKEYGVGSATA